MNKNDKSRYDFEEFLVDKFKGDPNSVLSKYNYESSDALFERIKNVDPNDLNELNYLIDDIVLWKLNRIVRIDVSILTKLTTLNKIGTIDDVLREANTFKKFLSKLLSSKGIRLAMASTILHFFNPDVFPIFDQRAYRVIFKEDYVASLLVTDSVDIYIRYLKKCRDYFNKQLKGKIPFSDLDKYLYQLDIEIGNKVKY